MAILLKRKIVRSDLPAKAMAAAVKGLSLPMEYAPPAGDLSDFDLLIHGQKKVGKTLLSMQCAEDEKVFVIEYDPERKAYRRLMRCPKSWEEFTTYLKMLEDAAASGDFPYRRVVIDGADQWFRHCQKSVCKKLVIEHPSEEAWGKGWDLLRRTFTDACDRLMNLPCGVWFLCHSVWKEVETHSNKKIQMLLPSLPGQAEEILNGKVEGWFAYDYIEGERVLFVQGNEKIGAGHALDGEGNPHFRTPKGVRIQQVPMGGSPREAYENLVKAYQNQQSYATLKERNAAKSPVVPKGVVLRKK